MLSIIRDQLAIKLDNIKRFNGCSLIKEESVSQHSYWVVFYVNLLLKNIFKDAYDGEKINYLSLYHITIRKAMFHDFEEVFVSDVVFNVKYHPAIGSVIKDALTNIVNHEINKLKPSILNDELKDVINNNEILSNLIIKIADWLSLYHFLYNEYKLGNKQEEVIRMMNLGENHLHENLNKLKTYCDDNKIPYSPSAIESVLN